jgi:hypothetical protein
MPIEKHQQRQGHRTPRQPSDLGDDLLIGIDAIAEFLSQPRRRVQHWATTRAIPLTKTGSLWTATKSVLRRHFNGPGGADE